MDRFNIHFLIRIKIVINLMIFNIFLVIRMRELTVTIIGGSGLEDILGIDTKFAVYSSPYGSIEYIKGKIEGVNVIFIPRHGSKHQYPPHRVPYFGNMYVAKYFGSRWVIGISAVGSLRRELKPGTVVIPDDLIDYTKTRKYTFFDDETVHIDFTKPYCEILSRLLYKILLEHGFKVKLGGVYVCFEGPRFETPAEIKMFQFLGADIVGMTNIPEAVLARELAMHYSLISIVTNYAAGIQRKISQDEVYGIMNKIKGELNIAVIDIIKEISKIRDIADYCLEHEKYAKKILGDPINEPVD